MPRYDRKYTNEEIAIMTDTLRQQASMIVERLTMAQAMLFVEARDELLTSERVKEVFTDVALGAQNLSAECDVLWRKTRQ